ncbi:hypothetical protein [Faecalibacterium sp. Marseille-Q3530]|uniref:hypothetical protein n=1 Tax=Faecalibacterium sp. Marseille-Q3530 TaxID=2758403 RepID=UPI001A9BCADF|nr:hypothetical protein [Faecalibacterium sp. Marseille-Q3530]MBO1290597.1 hypothetical protein [Faecalibacterium sp. Marseille-Q3530]
MVFMNGSSSGQTKKGPAPAFLAKGRPLHGVRSTICNEKNEAGLRPGARLRAGIVKIIADAANAVKMEESLAIFTKTEAIEQLFAN